MTSKTPARETLLVLLLVLLALGVRLGGIAFGLPYVYHVDEARFADISIKYLRGDPNPHFFHVPSLYTYLVAATWEGAYRVGKVFGRFQTRNDFLGRFSDDPSLFYILGRLLTVLMSVLTVYALYVLGKKMYGVRAGALAALFLIFSLEFNRASHYMNPDGPMILFLVLSFLFVWNVYERGRTRDYILAGLFAGLAFSTKYGGHVLFIPLVMAHAFRGYDAKKPALRVLFSPPLLFAGLAFVAAFLAGTPYAALDFPAFWKDFRWQAGHLYEFGHFGSAASVSVPLFYLRYGLAENLGPIVQLLALGGLVLGFAKCRRRDLILFAVPLVLLATVSGWKAYATRYLLPAAPFFILIAAFFLDRLLTLRPFAAQTPSRPAGAGAPAGGRAWLSAGLIVLAVLPSAVRAVKFDINLSRTDTRTVAKGWIEANIPPKTRVALEEYGPPISPEVYNVYFRKSLGEISFEWMSRRRIEYAVVNDIQSSRFLPYPKDFPAYAAFYRLLDERGVLLKTFAPKWDDTLVDLHNPTIKIYRLSTYPDPGFPGNFRKYAQSVTLAGTGRGTWTLRSEVRAAAPLARGERVSAPYVRLVDDKGGEAGSLVLDGGPFGADGASEAAASAPPIALAPGRYAIRVGYEFAFEAEVPGLEPSRRLRKEVPLGEFRVEADKPGKRVEMAYSYVAFPGGRGDDYVQSATLTKTGAGWRLTSAIYGGELRFGDDYVIAPFVQVVDGGASSKYVLSEGKVGSIGVPQAGGVRKSFPIPPFGGTPRLFAGYESYYDDRRPDRAGGPETVEFLLPPSFIRAP
ncbi:MAG: glycosyltransferase family 39 protein [Candidatus Aminicenantes bacterium]|nr:glycosyltransferase family 39 protein [Candidatus Aminicenantes bacterium]